MYSINLGDWRSVFAVPCAVVDRELNKANPDYVVVLLWILRHAGEAFTAATIHTSLSRISEETAQEALLYWQQQGLLRMEENDELYPANSQPLPGESVSIPPVPTPPPAEEKTPAQHLPSRPQKPDNAFVAKRMGESEEIAFLMQEAQQILGRLISNGDSASLLMIHDNFGLPVDVILMLLQYAVSIEKPNMRYIEKVAINWADEEIFTHEKAEEKLRQLSEHSRAWRCVEQLLGITHRSPTKAEDELSARWILEWGFSPDLIREAYERCVNQTGRMNIKYMNKILERWRKEGVSTLQQAQQEQTAKAAARKQADKPSFDLDEYERTSMYDTAYQE